MALKRFCIQIDILLVHFFFLQSTDPTALTTALKTALDAGYPLIDTAYIYRNEAIIGKVLQEYFTSGKLKRKDVFITTKVSSYHPNNYILFIMTKPTGTSGFFS